MQQRVARGGGVGGVGGDELVGKLFERGDGVAAVDIGGDGAQDQAPAAELLALKAEFAQKVQIRRERAVFLGGELRHEGSEQGLTHQWLLVGLHAVEIHALVRGVLVDEPDVFILVLADDVGVEHLTRDAPRRGGRGNERRLLDLGLFLLRRGKYGDGGRFRLGLCRSLRRRSDDWAGHDGAGVFLRHRQRDDLVVMVFHRMDRLFHRL